MKMENKTENDSRQRILCPVRGGKSSAPTVDKAIELAQTLSAPLYLLYIVDLDFLGLATVARVKIMADELAETGEFTLHVLAEKARNRGVSEVECVVREGEMTQVIREVADEINATVVLLGQAVRAPGTMQREDSHMQKIVDSLEAAGMEVITP
ncbi:MAG: universal stress protein [Deltaproteobacteria bacterium]|nr:universal stress protein [Deltaproteobacteria bacterium]